MQLYSYDWANKDKIGRITLTGAISAFPLPTSGGRPGALSLALTASSGLSKCWATGSGASLEASLTNTMDELRSERNV